MAIDWMENLEGKVREAAQEIRRLRAANDELNERIATLETEAESAQRSAKAAAPVVPEADAAWEQEREEVRRRVEKLVAQLEGLIREAESSEA
jgi:FtsZ-binding cell division protein ZapB